MNDRAYNALFLCTGNAVRRVMPEDPLHQLSAFDNIAV